MIVKMYDEEYEIRHSNCFGYEKIISKIDPLLNKHARTLCGFGLDFEDAKQEVIIILIDGIKNYDSDKNVKLSTFLHIHLKNKVISKIKTLTKKSRCASLEKNSSYKSEVSFSSLAENELDGYIPISSFSDFHYDEDKVQLHQTFEQIEKLYGTEASDLLYLVSIEGHTIVSASEILNINSWTASNKLKKISSDPRIINMLKEDE